MKDVGERGAEGVPGKTKEKEGEEQCPAGPTDAGRSQDKEQLEDVGGQAGYMEGQGAPWGR